ncbi:MAG: tetratricopeptide repeat protein [Proteobacteria bacterium]|nr:tetratricopeptide repeat protein [Desulfobacula sp.]MBU3951562.1 tetratricopeptide repeat protein [Pseudomonadota bacterium]MBU4132240.1 tetratricopeptide repeat protein [Pseudomonadota bacterium]
MGKNKETQDLGMVNKQRFYIAIMVSLTFGFMAGALYTSFKLANDAPVVQQNPHDQDEGSQETSAETGARILKLEQALKENPENVDAWTQLGNLFFDTDRFEDAIGAYEKSLALKPGDPSVLTDMGVMYRRNKNPQKAIESFDLAVAADPSFETARFNKGVVLMHDMEDMAGGIKAWEDLVKVNPMAKAPNGEPVSLLVERMKQQK